MAPPGWGLIIVVCGLSVSSCEARAGLDFYDSDISTLVSEKLDCLLSKPWVFADTVTSAFDSKSLDDPGVALSFSANLTQELLWSLIKKADDLIDMVFVGATVRLREVDSGDEDLYKIVGTATNDFSLDYVEVTSTSPLGEALMKARVGETVNVKAPRGVKAFEIIEIL